MLLFTVVKTGEHAVSVKSASAEVNQFDYICSLLQRKNFSLSETVSMVDLSELERMKPKSSLAVRRVASPCEDPVFGFVNDDLASFLKKPKSNSVSDLSLTKFTGNIGVLPRTLSVPTELDSFGERVENCNDQVIEIEEKEHCIPSLKPSSSCGDLACIPPIVRRSKSLGDLNMTTSPVQLNGDLAVSSLSASPEVNQFDYVCSLLSSKNFSLSETVFMMNLHEFERMKPKSSLAVRRVASPCEDPMFGDVNGDLVSFLNKPRSKSMSKLSSASTANSSVLPKTLSVPTELDSFGELAKYNNDEVIDSDEKEHCIPSLKPSSSCGDLAMMRSTSIKCDDLSFGGVNEKDEAEWFGYLSDLLVRKKFDPLSETVSMMDFEELIHRKPKSNLDCRNIQTLKSKNCATTTTSQLAISAIAQPQPAAAVDGSPKKIPKFQTLKRSWKNLCTNVRKLSCWSR